MLLQEYDIESAQNIQDAPKDLLGGTIKEMMEAFDGRGIRLLLTCISMDCYI